MADTARLPLPSHNISLFGLLNVHLRLQERLRNLCDGDNDSCMLLIAVILAHIRSGDAAISGGLPQDCLLMGERRLRAATATSLAAATGLPRETARRKLQALANVGILVRDRSGSFAISPDATLYQRLQRLLEVHSRDATTVLRDGASAKHGTSVRESVAGSGFDVG